MSVLLVGVEDRFAAAIASRLIEQSDEVRIMLDSPVGRERWRERSVYVAVGDAEDEDFVWRATGGVRTVVAGAERLSGTAGSVLAGGAKRAGVGRFIVLAADSEPGLPHELIEEGADLIVLRLPKKKLLSKEKLSPADVAEAVDAADDLAGSPRLDLDLSEPDAWRELRLSPPDDIGASD